MQNSNPIETVGWTGQVVQSNLSGGPVFALVIAVIIHCTLAGAFLFLSKEGSFAEKTEEQSEVQEVEFFVETVVEPVVEEMLMEPATLPVAQEVTEAPPVIEPLEVSKPRLSPVLLAVKPQIPQKNASKVGPISKPLPVVKKNTSRPAVVSKKVGRIRPVFPKYLNNPAPSYPKKARRRQLEGVVELYVRVSAKGTVLGLRVAKSSGHQLLDRSALKTVQHWRFLPAQRNGVSVAGEVIVPIRFELNKESV